MKYFFSAFYIRNLYDIIERKLSHGFRNYENKKIRIDLLINRAMNKLETND